MATSTKEKDREKGDFKAQTEKSMTESGSKGCGMEVEYGKGPKAISMSENGKKTKLMALECTFGSMEIDMKANSRTF